MIKITMDSGGLEEYIRIFYNTLASNLNPQHTSDNEDLIEKGIVNWQETDIKLNRKEQKPYLESLEKFKRKIINLGSDSNGKKFVDYELFKFLEDCVISFINLPFANLTVRSFIFTYCFIILEKQRGDFDKDVSLLFFKFSRRDIKCRFEIIGDTIIFDKKIGKVEVKAMFPELVVDSKHKNPLVPLILNYIGSLTKELNKFIIQRSTRFDIDYSLSATEEIVKGLLCSTSSIDAILNKYILGFFRDLVPKLALEYLPQHYIENDPSGKIRETVIQKIKDMGILIRTNNLLVEINQTEEYQNETTDGFIKTIQDSIGQLGIMNKQAGAKIINTFVNLDADKYEDTLDNLKNRFNSLALDIFEERLPNGDIIVSNIRLTPMSSITDLKKKILREVKGWRLFKYDSDDEDILKITEIDSTHLNIRLIRFVLSFQKQEWIAFVGNSPFSFVFESQINGVPTPIVDEILSSSDSNKYILTKTPEGFIVDDINNLGSGELYKQIIETISIECKFYKKTLDQDNLVHLLSLEKTIAGKDLLKLKPFKDWFDKLYPNQLKEDIIDPHFSNSNAYDILNANFEKFEKDSYAPHNLNYENEQRGSEFSTRSKLCNSDYLMTTCSALRIGTEILYYEVNLSIPILNMTQIANKITIKPIHLLDYLHSYFKRLINRYNKDFNLLAKRVPRNVVDDFMGRGAFSVNHSIGSSIGAGMKRPMESYKKRIGEEPANIFIAFDESSSMGGYEQMLSYRLILGLLAYGFNERFATLVYGLITDSLDISAPEYDPVLMIKMNKRYIERANAINFEIGYSISSCELHLIEIVNKINEISVIIADPTVVGKDRYIWQKRIYQEEYFRNKFQTPPIKAMISVFFGDKVYRSDRSMKIKYGETEKTFKIGQSKPRRFIEFNNILDYLKTIVQQNLVSCTSFSGA